MAQCPPCAPSLSCNDSPYSVAGNTMGILTFVYAVLATFWIYFSRLRSADVEQKKLMDTAYANYVRWKLMINEYEDVLKAGGQLTGDVSVLLKHRFETGGEAMHKLDMALEYDPNSGAAKRTKQRGKFVLGQRELQELLSAANNATHEVHILLDGITQEQMHRDLKLQHALLQQIASKLRVTEQATAEMRKLVEEAPEGAPIAALLRTPPLSDEKPDPSLTLGVAKLGEDSDSGHVVSTQYENNVSKTEV